MALLHHQMSKKRLFPLIAYFYLKLSVVLKRYIYRLGLATTTTPTTTGPNAILYTLQHPVLLHRELLSTVLNYICSVYVKLPQLPYSIQDNIIRLSLQHRNTLYNQNENNTQQQQNPQQKQKQEPSNNQYEQDSIEEAPHMMNGSIHNDNSDVHDVDQNPQTRFSQDPRMVAPFVKFVTWLEERSQIRYSLPALQVNDTTQNTHMDMSAFANLGITASTLCVSLVNILPLVEMGVYTAAANTPGARLWRLFRSVGMAKIVILNEHNQPIGIITRKDMVRADKFLVAQMNTLKTKLKQQ